MRYAGIFAVVGAGFLLVGCASAPRVVVDYPLGPAPAGVAQGTGEGSIVIYSARTPADVDACMAEWRWNNDFGKNAFLYERAHTDYTIYQKNGEVFQHVRNARNADDDNPTQVPLPPGSYRVVAEGINCSSDRVKVVMTVVIQPGQTTLANLEGGWNPTGEYQETQVAKLPCGRAIGWRAPEAGYAGIQAGSRAN